MNNQEYLKLAMRTECNHSEALIRIEQDALTHSRWVHGCLGIQSDWYEYQMAKDRNNAKEELGDMCWYLAEALTPFGEKYKGDLSQIHSYAHTVCEFCRSELYNEVDKLIGDWAYFLEKRFYYLQDNQSEELCYILNCLWIVLTRLASMNGFAMEEVLSANITKLQKRFPEKFDHELAKEENRDRAAEARAMDDGVSYE